MTEQTHTPTPWQKDQRKDHHFTLGVPLYDASGFEIAKVLPAAAGTYDHVDLIVRAVNAHADMLAALQSIAEGHSPFVQAVAREAIKKAVGQH